MLFFNVGEEFRFFVRIASGGELSRIMFVIKYVLVVVDIVDCYVFDEVDIGVSGVIVEYIGVKFWEIVVV